jgi:hypothetical protein
MKIRNKADWSFLVLESHGQLGNIYIRTRDDYIFILVYHPLKRPSSSQQLNKNTVVNSWISSDTKDGWIQQKEDIRKRDKKKLKIPAGEKPQGCSPATMRTTNNRWSNDHPRLSPQTPSDSFTSRCRWMISERWKSSERISNTRIRELLLSAALSSSV